MGVLRILNVEDLMTDSVHQYTGIKCRYIKSVWDYVSPGLIVVVLSDVVIKCPVLIVAVLTVAVLNVVLPNVSRFA